ncbi:MAG TPA: hypothetical protein VLK36_06840 [Gaiellaceae bacterium]|nr:hypothetical protein [Gaiellaceae bacterium]
MSPAADFGVMPRRLSRRDRLVVGLVAAAAVAVRLPDVWSQSLWEDEVASARIIAQPTLLQMLARVVRTESTPPLWYLGEWLLHRAGMPMVDGRLVSVFLGGLLLVLVIGLARWFLSFPLALAAGLLVGLGGEFVRHGSELRAYELLAVLTVLLARCLIAQMTEPRRKHAAALAATVAAGGLTHFFFAFSVLAALSWLLVDPTVRARRRQTVLPMVAGGLVAMSWIPLMLVQYHPTRLAWIGSFHLRPVLAVPLRLFSYAETRPLVGPVLSLLALLLVLTGGIRLGRRSSAGRLLLVLALAPLAEAALVWRLGMPIFDLRNLIGVGAFCAITGLAALDALPRRAAVTAASTLCVLTALSLASSGLRWIPPYQQMARTLIQRGWNGTQAIAIFGDPYAYRSPLEWYLPGRPTLTIHRPGTRRCGVIYILHATDRVSRQTWDHADRASGLQGAVFLVAGRADPPRRTGCA